MLPTNPKYETAIAAMLYIVRKLERRDILRVFKLLYFADKRHLQRYGRMIVGDDYVAFPQGPLPTHLYDYVQIARGDSPHNSDLSPEGLKSFQRAFRVVNGFHLEPQTEPDLDLLSVTDRRVLDEVVENYGELPRRKLSELSHDDAWKYGRSVAPQFRMDLSTIVSSLENADEVREHLEQRAVL